ncbi:hypothetical protein [Deinococcus pimensis]|uniref:hypothetical protein n=1 Tax=Deinococcus pimensis TaxID=309888 RepID=UPI00047F3390|nr:hypothetical protein [Deinococcus pimensis]
MRPALVILFVLLNLAFAGGAGPPLSSSSAASPRPAKVPAVPGGTSQSQISPGIDLVSTGEVGRYVVILGEFGNTRSGRRQLRIIVRSTVNRHTVWHRDLDGRFLGAATGPRRGWQVIGNVLWVGRISNAVDWTNDIVGFRLLDGRQLWATTATGLPLAGSHSELLFRQRRATGLERDPSIIRLLIVRADTGALRSLEFVIPPRAGCGRIDDELLVEKWLEHADARQFVAQRSDRCGFFTVSYDWHGLSDQVPVVRSVRP